MLLGPGSLSLEGSIVLSLVTAAGGAIASFLLAVNQSRSERERLLWQDRVATHGQFASLRQQYIAPLRYWASLLERRMKELEQKKQQDYNETSSWFRQVKAHADRTKRIDDFPYWSSYVGSFAVTTLYWTTEFLEASRQISFHSPFNEIDPNYSALLKARLDDVRSAFMKDWGMWDTSQEIVAQLAATDNGSSLNYQEFCRMLHDADPFKIGPLLRPLDYYIGGFNETIGTAEDFHGLRVALKELIEFIDSQRTPERLVWESTRRAPRSSEPQKSPTDSQSP